MTIPDPTQIGCGGWTPQRVDSPSDAAACSRSLPERLRLSAYAPRPELEKIHNEAAAEIESLREKLMVIYGDACAIRDSWLKEQPDGIGMVIRNIRRLSISSESARGGGGGGGPRGP